MCGCGTPVRGKWARGHAARGEGGGIGLAAGPSPLPGPDSPEWAEDAGIIDIEGPGPEPGPSLSGGPGTAADSAGVPGPPQPPPADEPPAHARRDWHAKAPKARVKAPRITAGVRTDIAAKISLPLEIYGRVWEAKDGLCGGRFVQQRPAIADAFTNIICDSPALVAFFTGPAGGFMKYLELGAAVWPVFEMVMAHHVYHSIETGEPGPNPSDLSQYAA